MLTPPRTKQWNQYSTPPVPQLTSEVNSLQSQVATLEQQLQGAQAAAAEAQQAKDALVASAEQDADAVTALQQQLVAAQGRMEAVSKERDMLQDKVGQLRTENKRLNEALGDVAALQERLAAAEAAVEVGEAAQARASQLQGTNERLQREHASVNGMVARLEEKLRQVRTVKEPAAFFKTAPRLRRSWSIAVHSWTLPASMQQGRRMLQQRSCRGWRTLTGRHGPVLCGPWWRPVRQLRQLQQQNSCKQRQKQQPLLQRRRWRPCGKNTGLHWLRRRRRMRPGAFN